MLLRILLALALSITLQHGIAVQQRDDLPGRRAIAHPVEGILEIRPTGGSAVEIVWERPAGAWRDRVDLAELTGGARIVEAGIEIFRGYPVPGDQPPLLLALVLEEGDGRHSYRFAHNLPQHSAPGIPLLGDRWYVSEPLFTSEGMPYRIVDVHNPAGDSIEITFRRHRPPVPGRDRPGAPPFQEKIYVNHCPGYESVAATGIAVLADVGVVWK